MLQKICIIVTTFNRKAQTEVCLKQLKEVKGENNELWIYDDRSSEYNKDFLDKFGDHVIPCSHMGIEEQRKNQFLYFNGQSQFDFLYLTDNDTFHDPDWLSKVSEFYLRYHLPISLYNSECHQNFTIETYEDCFLRKHLPGVSVLLDKSMVKIVFNDIILRGGLYGVKGGFDWRIGELFQNRVVVSKSSYLEHYGFNGMHSKLHIDNKGDWAVNPTKYLEEKKPFLISLFNQEKI